VVRKTGFSYPTIWKMMMDGRFPRSRDWNGNARWIEAEVDETMLTLPIKKLKSDDNSENQDRPNPDEPGNE
jgi:hypothetical protein